MSEHRLALLAARVRAHLGAPLPPTRIASQIELHRFGGLKGLRKHGHYKEVRLADPFAGGQMLHFPTTLHADNWLLSCFGRSLKCSVPMEPLQALDRGQLISTRCSLIVRTPQRTIADLVLRRLDNRGREKWARFQTAAKAHGLHPVLRTSDEIRANPLRLRNLERMRQQLVQQLPDSTGAGAAPLVELFLEEHPITSLGELCHRMAQLRLARGAVECALITLYRLKAVDLDISEAVYGDNTRIQLL